MLKYMKRNAPELNTVLLSYHYASPFSTVVIMAGSPTHDFHGARLMRNLKKNSKEQLNFVGLGGEEMKAEGLQQNFGDISKFLDKPFMPYKNFLRFHVERPYHPVLANYHWHNRQVLQELEKQGFYSKIIDLKPEAFITLGNEFFMRRCYQKVAETYKNHDTVRPPTFFVDRVHINQRHEFKLYLDHFFNTIPRKQINWGYFTFPHTTVGHQGVGRAWQYLLSRSTNFKSLQGENHIYINHKHNRDLVSSLVEQERVRFRKQTQIAESATVIYVGAGNTENDAKWALPLAAKGLEKFFKRDEIKNLDKQNFVVVVSVPNGASSQSIEAIASKTGFDCRVVQVKTDADQWSAMAGSDIGLALNGELISECAATQLPTIVLDHTPLIRAYFLQLYNSFNVDINIAINGEAYQELLSTASNPEQISEQLYEHFADPKLRYYYIDRYHQALIAMVPTAASQTGGAASTEITFENRQFQRHEFTQDKISHTVFKSIEAYRNTNKRIIPQYQIDNAREQLLQNLGWD